GETRELAVGFPQDYAVAELRGKEGRFQVKAKGLKKREVPALDDQFAQDLGGEAKTLAELRQKVREEMTAQEKDRKESAQREALLSALVEKNPIEAPPALEVKGYLLLEAIADKEAIEASEEDLEKHYAKLAGELKQPVEKLRQAFRRQDSVGSLKGRLRQDKALAFLLGKANLV